MLSSWIRTEHTKLLLGVIVAAGDIYVACAYCFAGLTLSSGSHSLFLLIIANHLYSIRMALYVQSGVNIIQGS